MSEESWTIPIRWAPDGKSVAKWAARPSTVPGRQRASVDAQVNFDGTLPDSKKTVT
jgi:hypothetical protein